MDIICIGEMVIDFLPGEDSGVYIRKAGGAPANVAIAAARNNLDAGFCGCVGDDDFGRFLFNTLSDNGVAILCPDMVKEAVTTMAFVTLSPSGDRSFTFARKPGADMFLTRAHIDQAKVVEAKIIHAGSCSLSKNPAADATIYAMEQGKKAGRLVSFDVNYRNLLWEDDRKAAMAAVQKVLPLVDFLKFSQEESDMIGGEENITATAKENDISVVVETLGAEGARCYWKEMIITIPGMKARCVDTTGAGDAFWGAFIARLLKSGVESTDDLTEVILKDALHYGNISGWLCVQKKGAIESLPTSAEIEAIKMEMAGGMT
jgi:fructokinase